MASSNSSSSDELFKIVRPKITQDPRFRAGRKLIESGRDGAIPVFAMLLQEATTKYGEVSIETAPAYFQYGCALFREASRKQLAEEEEEEAGEDDEKPAAKQEDVDGDDEDKKPAAKQEDGDGNSQEEDKEEDTAVKEEDTAEEANDPADGNKENEETAAVAEADDDEEEDDFHLALSMMENAFAILDTFVKTTTSALPTATPANRIYLPWVQRQELPRCLSNLGDLLSYMERRADAADAYTRTLAMRQENLKGFEGKTDNRKTAPIAWCLEELKERRLVGEAAVLVATELLECPDDQDVVTMETKSLLVKAGERDAFAEGYYFQARDALQDTVYLLAEITGRCERSGATIKAAFLREKEDVCFASTLIMGVGEKLAELKEEGGHDSKQQQEPVKKKAKR